MEYYYDPEINRRFSYPIGFSGDINDANGLIY